MSHAKRQSQTYTVLIITECWFHCAQCFDNRLCWSTVYLFDITQTLANYFRFNFLFNVIINNQTKKDNAC